MSSKTPGQIVDEAAAWWTTEIVDIQPGHIGIRGYPIQQLIGNLSFPAMIWLMLRGEVPSDDQARLLEAALVAAVDHGPHAPSIAISRMAVTCGLPINGAMASAINALDDIHGGAGQQCMELIQEIAAELGDAEPTAQVVEQVLERYVARNGKIVPGTARSSPASATAGTAPIRAPSGSSRSCARRRPRAPWPAASPPSPR
jgi:citrate synthase